MRDGWQAPLGALVLVVLFAAFNSKRMDTAADIAAWVQGVGSVIAIAVAVWIYAQQSNERRAEDLGQTVAFVQAMRDEVQVIWEEYKDIRQDLLHTHPNGFFTSIVPLGTDSLIVYSRTPERVAKIDDEALRILTVRTFTGLRGYLNSLRQNNVRVEDYERSCDNNPTGSIEIRKRLALQNYTTRLKLADAETTNLVEQFLHDTEAWLHPRRKANN